MAAVTTAKKSAGSPLASAKPGAAGAPAATKDKKEKVVKVPFVDHEADEVKLIEGKPEGYSPKKHLPLKKADFKNEWEFYDWRADRAEAQAAKFRKEAEQSKTLGSSKDRAKKKQLLSLVKKIEALKSDLEGEGNDVAALLATLGIEE